ncbi:uncharacterized protein LOC126700017 isoform X1 [Quercus robur]|uniref:uncharacterized protein LOC126700017 isoform X1 n=1 Tax=Quercus robur TaxID=38942 RepID=UPI002162F5F9|nr:uncharacterized protein LOC126700017 isoform X1 [Quercus robur]
MSIISSFFILLLFLSMHEYCNARGLGVIDKASSLQFIVSEKVEEKVKHNMETIQGGTDGNNIDDKSQGGATTQIPGCENSKSSCHMGLLRETRINKGSRRRALSIIGSKVKEDIVFNGNKVQAVEVTDYEPPHQTPPIHN